MGEGQHEAREPHLARCSSGKAQLGETIWSNLRPGRNPGCSGTEREHLSSGLASPGALTLHTLLLGLEPVLGAVGGCPLCPLEVLWTWVRDQIPQPSVSFCSGRGRHPSPFLAGRSGGGERWNRAGTQVCGDTGSCGSSCSGPSSWPGPGPF